MPYLLIRTNCTPDSATQAALIRHLSGRLANWLGKPEQYVMVAIQPGSAMIFAGSDAPCAYLELKSIGLPEAQLPDLSALLGRAMADELGISTDRVYIEFSASEPQWWGWNCSTF
ncbi:MAG TPA: phenylpyruvate tautomerase MIF-related protein [Gammaproteobacteria bacterium]